MGKEKLNKKEKKKKKKARDLSEGAAVVDWRGLGDAGGYAEDADEYEDVGEYLTRLADR